VLATGGWCPRASWRCFKAHTKEEFGQKMFRVPGRKLGVKKELQSSHGPGVGGACEPSGEGAPPNHSQTYTNTYTATKILPDSILDCVWWGMVLVEV